MVSVLRERIVRHRVVGLAATVGVALVVVGLGLGAPASPLASARPQALQTGAAYAVGVDATRHGVVVAFDTRTGALLKRVHEPYVVQSPDILVSPAGDRLFLLEGRVSADYKTVRMVLTLIDTRSWTALAHTSLPDAFRYNVTGPSTMVLTPDGSRLLVYRAPLNEGDGLNDWLSFVDPATLTVLPTRVSLPGCGAARFATANNQVIALCSQSNDVRFIDPRAATLITTVALPVIGTYDAGGRPVGLVVSRDQGLVYVVSNDLRIMAISTTHHVLIREVTTWRQQPQTVPTLDDVVGSPDGQRLIVGVMAQPRDTASGFALQVFTLPDLTLLHTVSLAHYAHLVAAPTGGLYTFQMGDQPAGLEHETWDMQMLSSDLTQATTTGQFDGQLFHVVIPRMAYSGSR